MPAKITATVELDQLTSPVFLRRHFISGVASFIAIRPSTSNPTETVSGRLFSEFGAIGDGRADDTVALNQAANWSAAANRPVIGRTGAVYRVTSASHSAFLSPGGGRFIARCAVQVPDRAEMDFAHAILRASDGSIAISNRRGYDGSDRISIRRLNIDGRHVGEYAALFSRCERSTFHEIAVEGSTVVGIAFAAAAECDLDALSAVSCVGQAIILGGNTAWQLHNCRIGQLSVRDNRSLGTFHQPGNPYLIGARDTSLEMLSAMNCGGGIKFTSNSKRLRCGYIGYDGPLAGDGFMTDNSGVKFQGDDETSQLEDVWIRHVRVRRCGASGLFIRHTRGLTIHSYEGTGNGWWGRHSDIHCSAGAHLHMDSGEVAHAGQRALLLDREAGVTECDLFRIRGGLGNQSGILVTAGKLKIRKAVLDPGPDCVRLGRNAAPNAAIDIEMMDVGAGLRTFVHQRVIN